MYPKIRQKIKVDLGATCVEYALCCALLCLSVVGVLSQTSAGVDQSFQGLYAERTDQARMNCPVCSSSGGGNSGVGGGQNFADQGSDVSRAGGGSDTSQTVTFLW